MNNTNTILIGFADALSAPEVAYNLIENGFQVVAFVRKNSRKPALKRFQRVQIAEIQPPEEDPRQALNDLIRLYQTTAASAVMPLNDRSVWLCDKVAQGFDIRIAGPTGKAAAFALDKRIQIRAAMAAGFNVPETVHIINREDTDKIEIFPVVLKSALAVAEENGKPLPKEKLHFCLNRNELDKVMHSWKSRQPLIAQTVHHGVGEGLFGFATPKGVHCGSAHRRVRMMNPKGSGSSACRALTITDHPVSETEKMLSAIGWRGLFMVEMLRDSEGKLWFVEFNGRPWGSMALALRMGFDYPAWAAKQIGNPDFVPDRPAPKQAVTCRHLGRELIHILQVFRGPSSPAIPNWPSIGQTLKQVLRINRNDRWYNWRSYNKTLFISDTYNTIMDETVRKWSKK